MIDAAAEAAYCRSYGLMQELRAQQAADSDLHIAVDECLREARLRENEIDCRWRIDPAVGELDRDTRALVLRNIRGFANFCKSLGRCERISVDLQPALGRSDCLIDLALGYTGSFEQLDSDDPVLKSIAGRTIAIGGEMLLGCDARSGCFTLNLYFDPLLTDCSKPA
jgi:glucose-6-phosphate-specific signal transduction histidine kinase